MNNKSIFGSFLVVVTTIVLLASCDKDFNEVGSDITDDSHFGLELDTLSSVTAFNQATNIVQSNNLLVNSLGVYNNPVFGITKASFVTQLQMASANPTFDKTLFENQVMKIDSVVLTVPYFSKLQSTLDSKGIYTLDSITAPDPKKLDNKLNLKIFESGYQMSDLDPDGNFQQTQKYFNDDTRFESNKITIASSNGALNDGVALENSEFVPDVREYITYKRTNVLKIDKDNVDTRLTPRMALHLNTAFFEQKIFNAPSGKLLNNGVFKEYFKGLYFQADAVDAGQLMRLDFSKGNVTIYYKQYSALKLSDPADLNSPKIPVTFDDDSNSSTPEVPKFVIKSFVLNMTGNTVNLLEQTNTPTYAGAIATPNPTTGDEKLYLKGGANGSVALIDLFGPDIFGEDGMTGVRNGIPDELDKIKKNGWLINEANLTFYIDNTSMGLVAPHPQRIYLYDAKHNIPIYDYYVDGTTATNTKLNKYVFGGLLANKNSKPDSYKIRITNYLRNLIQKDSVNVRLGLAVTESILTTTSSKLKTNANPGNIDRIPSSSVMNPLGTILYGNRPNAPENKKLKLEIYYTKPK